MFSRNYNKKYNYQQNVFAYIAYTWCSEEMNVAPINFQGTWKWYAVDVNIHILRCTECINTDYLRIATGFFSLSFSFRDIICQHFNPNAYIIYYSNIPYFVHVYYTKTHTHTHAHIHKNNGTLDEKVKIKKINK